MAVVNIELRGRTYVITCAEGEEPMVENLAKGLRTRVDQIAARTAGGTDAHLLLLAALDMAHDLEEAKTRARKSNDGQRNQDILVSAVSHLTERVRGMVDRLENA